MADVRIEQLYIFVGPPGAGKGSLSHLLERGLGFKQLSTGNLCRWHITQGTRIGQEIDLAIKSGKLVPDELVTEMVGGWLGEQEARGLARLILDGYPRTVAQAHALARLLGKQYGGLHPRIVRLVASEETIVSRLANRYVCRNKRCQMVYSAVPGSGLMPKVSMVCDKCGEEIVRRPDDAEEAVRERLKVYRTHEAPLLEAAQEVGWPVSELNVERSPQEIFGELKEMVGLAE